LSHRNRDTGPATPKRQSFAAQLLDPPSHPEMLGRIDRYDIECLIGQGGFGVVFKGFDSELHRPVAIKVLAPHLANSGVARRRFAREAQAAAAVNHPNVVPIHAVAPQAELPYLVMSFVPGHSLQTIVMKYGPLDPVSVVRIGKQIAAGLAAAHRQGLVHRDIKPANVLLENDLNRAMITDFGLARAADDAAATQTGWLAGTPHYMSPEQASGRDIDARSDLFSLGSVLYFMATGREPFRGDSPLAILRQIGEQQPLSARQINAEVPRTLSSIIDRLLEKRPQDRYDSAEETELLLEQYLAHLQHPQSRPAPKQKMHRRTRRRILIGSLITLASLASVFALKTIPLNVWPSSNLPENNSTNIADAPSNWADSWKAIREHEAELKELQFHLDALEQDVTLAEQQILNGPQFNPALSPSLYPNPELKLNSREGPNAALPDPLQQWHLLIDQIERNLTHEK
jgi:serine/threonine-protein kinase